jgi:GNAT superfamily N-acetyltransferase
MSCTVRVAIDLDLLSLVELGEEYFNEVNEWNHMAFNRDKVTGFAIFAISNKSHNIFVAIDDDTNRPVGFFWGCVIEHVWTDEPMGQDMFMFVRKEARGYGAGKKLIQAFTEWCKVSGCKSIQCGAHSGIENNEPAKKVFESLGFNLSGYSYHLKV